MSGSALFFIECAIVLCLFWFGKMLDEVRARLAKLESGAAGFPDAAVARVASNEAAIAAIETLRGEIAEGRMRIAALEAGARTHGSAPTPRAKRRLDEGT